MAEVHDLADHRREFITSAERSDLRATWHDEAGYVVISLWHGDRCVATSHLTPKEAGRLATFITGGLADLANESATRGRSIALVAPESPWPSRLQDITKAWRERVAWTLERIAKHLR